MNKLQKSQSFMISKNLFYFPYSNTWDLNLQIMKKSVNTTNYITEAKVFKIPLQILRRQFLAMHLFIFFFFFFKTFCEFKYFVPIFGTNKRRHMSNITCKFDIVAFDQNFMLEITRLIFYFEKRPSSILVLYKLQRLICVKLYDELLKSYFLQVDE